MSNATSNATEIVQEDVNRIRELECENFDLRRRIDKLVDESENRIIKMDGVNYTPEQLIRMIGNLRSTNRNLKASREEQIEVLARVLKAISVIIKHF